MCQPTQLPHLSELPTLYRSAALHIELFGLAQGWFCASGDDIDGAPLGERPTCTIGAISWATTGSPLLVTDDEVADEAVRFISSHLPGEPGTDMDTGEPAFVEHVATWNDAPERTAGEVVGFLRRLAQEAQEADLLCRYIAEHDDHLPCDWCSEDVAKYQQELQTLRLAVAA